MKTALAAGLLIASPYILYLLFRFVSPALYDNERRYSVSIIYDLNARRQHSALFVDNLLDIVYNLSSVRTSGLPKVMRV